MLLFNRYNLLLLPPLLDFNTSNVTIQQVSYFPHHQDKEISIHLMLLFNDSNQTLYFLLHTISIHLMLLFNFQFGTAIKAPLMISIHLMLLFNNDGNITGAVIKRISIHLMLLFNLCLQE